MGVSVKNVIQFIWFGFSGILTLRLTNPLYNILFSLDWSGSWTARVTSWILKIGFAIFIFGVAFFLPIQKLTNVGDKIDKWREGGDEEYYNG